MKIDCIIGIDPGASGGITVWRPNAKEISVKIPKDISDFRDFMMHYKEISNPLIFIEKVQMHKSDAQGGKTFGIEKLIRNVEQLRTVLAVLDIPFVPVHPMTWQSRLNLRRGVEEKSQRKKRYKEHSQKLYPDLKSTMWNCDATLLMHFGRFILKNDVKWVLENLPAKNHDKLF